MKLRLVVYRDWNQISVKDFEVEGKPTDWDEVEKYAFDTWKESIKIIEINKVE